MGSSRASLFLLGSAACSGGLLAPVGGTDAGVGSLHDAASDARRDARIPHLGTPDASTPEAPAIPPPTGSCVSETYGFDGGCGYTLVDPHNCGTCGHDCMGGICQGGVCASLPSGVLASGQTAWALAVDATDVYWTNEGTSTPKQGPKTPGLRRYGAVMKCAKTGCNNTPTVVASGQCLARAIAVDGESVYWSSDAGISKCPKAGCAGAPITLAPGPTGAFAIDAANIYWFDNGGTLSKMGLDGSSPNVLATGLNLAFQIAVDDINVYWGEELGGLVRACTKTGCMNTPLTLASGQLALDAIGADGTNVYWTNANSESMGAVFSCPKGGCGGAPTVFAAMQSNAFGFALDGQSVFWTQIDASGQLLSCPVTGCGSGGPATIATGQYLMGGLVVDGVSLAVDDANVYWTSMGGPLPTSWPIEIDEQIRMAPK